MAVVVRMPHEPLTDTELADLVTRCDDSFAAKQLALSYRSLRAAYEDSQDKVRMQRAGRLLRGLDVERDVRHDFGTIHRIDCNDSCCHGCT